MNESTSNMFEVDYYRKLEEGIELQYHSKHNRVFLSKCYWYDTSDRKIRVDPHHGLVKINKKARLHNVDDVFIFAKICQQVYYIYTLFFRNDHSRVDWLSTVKMKPRGCVQVVQDSNDKVIAGDDVFRLDELVDVYRVASSTDLEENSNFHVAKNNFIDVNADELNNILRTSGYTKVNEDDDINELQFNEENYDGHDDDKIKEEKDSFD